MPFDRSPRTSPLLTALAAVVFAALAAGAPAWGYTIFLKDGSKLIATDKYTVRGDKAIIVLESGTETMLPLSEIDVPRTEKSNEENIGTAVVIEGGKAQELAKNAPPPARKATLQDLIQSRGNQPDGGEGAPAPAPVRRARTEPAPSSSQDVVGRSPLRNVELAGAIRSFLFGRGITSVEVLQGPAQRRPLLVFSTGTEGQVFKALGASATALLHVRDQRSGEVDAFEVVLNSTAGGSAGRFSITPQMAQDLVANRIEMPAFYVKYVQF